MNIPKNKPQYYSSTEIAKTLNVSRITVFRWIKTGKLKGIKAGRNYIITFEDYSSFLFDHVLTEEQRNGMKKAVNTLMNDMWKTLE